MALELPERKRAESGWGDRFLELSGELSPGRFRGRSPEYPAAREEERVQSGLPGCLAWVAPGVPV